MTHVADHRERDHGTGATVPPHIWRHNVQLAAIKTGAARELVMSIGEELTASGQPRLSLWYASGESICDAADMLAFMAKGRARDLAAESDLRFRRLMGRNR